MPNLFCTTRPKFSTLFLSGALSLLSGCAVGPDFVKPQAPDAAAFAPSPLPGNTEQSASAAGEAQSFVEGQNIPFDWWTSFGSANLNALVELALKQNPSIPAAQAALRQAQEMVYAQQGYFFPAINGGYSFERQKDAGNQGSATPGPQGNGKVIQPSAPAQPTYYSTHTAQLTVGFTPDLFGANRRQVESLQANAEVQHDLLQAAYVSLAANIVAAAIQEGSVRDQMRAVQAIIRANEKTVEILKAQQKNGYAMGLDVAAAATALAQARQLLPPLDKQLRQTRDLERALTGNLPNQEIPEIAGLNELHLPTNLPVSLPSKIIEQRPDVRAAEQQWRAANAQLGVAIAARLPQFTITGAYGGVASEFGQMFSHGGPFWNVIGDVSAPIFDGNGLLHKERAADQALIQAASQYRSTVITAYQNVADSLHAVITDADALRAAAESERAAKFALDLTKRQNEVGYVNTQTLLAADMAYQQASLTLVQAKTNRFGDSAALYQALGGGWWNRSDLAADRTQGDMVLDMLN